MRLVKVELKGYKRLRDTSINVDAPVVAVVGPNEAGKTSLLDALAHLSREGAFAPRELSRKLNPSSNAVIIRAWFELESADSAIIGSIPEAASARWFVVEKLADGRLQRYLTPRIDRDRSYRQKLGRAVRTLSATKWAKETTFGENGASVADQVSTILGVLESDVETLDSAALGVIRAYRDRLKELDGPASCVRAIEAIEPAVRGETRPHPRDTARDSLLSQVPQLLKFDLPDRDLASEYDLTAVDIGNPPAALENLTQVAGFDLAAAVTSVRTSDYGEKLGMIEAANARLQEVFTSSWSQTDTLVRFDQDEQLLRIFVSNPGGGYSAIAERSDGLRAFVALIAFTTLAESQVKPILLIDEAETHLHYDAQADLMRVFARQEAAAKIIYTTHSAGCLPEDLGTGIRLIGPVQDSDESKVRNSFWTAKGGFANLLIGMGASALAFASTRHALIGEGGADVVLLPTLLREATARDVVGFQVAPGLAEAAPTAVAELDLTGARVAYVIDDDEGGRSIGSKLRAAGIPKERIIVLGRRLRKGLVLEDTLEASVFRDAVNAEWKRSGGTQRLPLSAVPARGRPAALTAWAKGASVKPPNRAAVANQVLALRSSGRLLSVSGSKVLRQLDEDARSILGLA